MIVTGWREAGVRSRYWESPGVARCGRRGRTEAVSIGAGPLPEQGDLRIADGLCRPGHTPQRDGKPAYRKWSRSAHLFRAGVLRRFDVHDDEVRRLAGGAVDTGNPEFLG